MLINDPSKKKVQELLAREISVAMAAYRYSILFFIISQVPSSLHSIAIKIKINAKHIDRNHAPKKKKDIKKTLHIYSKYIFLLLFSSVSLLAQRAPIV